MINYIKNTNFKICKKGLIAIFSLLKTYLKKILLKQRMLRVAIETAVIGTSVENVSDFIPDNQIRYPSNYSLSDNAASIIYTLKIIINKINNI